MGLNDALNKAKDLAGEHPDQVNQAIDGANAKAQDAAPDQFDSSIDGAAGKAQGALGGNADAAETTEK
ncbi:antitoxin [Brachybacterium sp. JHP9]|uniref:Antitoxin n=1 Tax=Brachybacterium equifaecis TaxID=2910770 RepID=A0ABT0QZ24_9MICO|nr:antitoxin [Brachybacterium equifaecis]MCL6422886.1 antitoxin [Brachybacterium equifaecis]